MTQMPDKCWFVSGDARLINTYAKEPLPNQDPELYYKYLLSTPEREAAAELVENLEGLLQAYESLCAEHKERPDRQPGRCADRAKALLAKIEAQKGNG